MTNQKENPTSEDQNLQTLILIWFALTFSQALFFVIIYFIKPNLRSIEFSQPLFGKNSFVILALLCFAVSSVALSFFVRSIYRRRSVYEQSVGLVQSGLIVGCAICEASSLMGIVLALAFDYAYFFIFNAFGILGTVLHFPRRREIQDATFKK